MNCKPILTYSGDSRLFKSLEPHIVAALPSDTAEWKRSYGRPVKNVRVEATFKPLDVTLLEKYNEGNWSIVDHPVLHLYVTECSDIEAYRASVKEEIDQWLKVLTGFNITDWMIVLVETLDIKKSKNILPRTTVLDKIRLDFASKNGDRCLSVLNPSKFEMKGTESFRCLLQRVRHLMLTGYNRNIVKYEELIRSNRENRVQENWNFIDYFLLQEQLAFVLEMLGQYSEALVQYDELDALFSQFILNSVYGEKQKWLQIFDQPLYAFHGISMNPVKMEETRSKIIIQSVNLLEFRSYLFERQCLLLDTNGKPWEIAERLLPFLFSTLREIDALKLETPEGALECWEFVCALEVLYLCDKVQESKDIYKCSQYSAPIWNLAKDKLYSLGKQCGLLPGCTPSSEQLHTVVHLSAGIGDTIPENSRSSLLEPESTEGKKPHSPARKPRKSAKDSLKEALGSNQAFTKLYLELSELAISTYKHVSRLRSARLVGLDLGTFYITLNEPQKAVVFFTDLLRELKTENWHFLSSQTLLQLASCYKKMDDIVSYTKTCGAIACCVDLEKLVRTFYFDEFLTSLKQLKAHRTTDINALNVITVLEDHFQIIDINLTHSSIVQDDVILVVLKLESNFPREIPCEQVQLSFEMDPKQASESPNAQPGLPEATALLPITLHLDYKQDDTLSCASVACDNKTKQPVRRTSSTRRRISPTQRSDFTNCVASEKMVLQPGLNTIELKVKAKRVGSWTFKQLSIQIDNVEFLSESLPTSPVNFEIITKASSAVLNFMNLIAGVEQPVKLIVSGGSFRFSKDASITLKCSKNLRMRLANSDEQCRKASFQRELIIGLHDFQSFEERAIDLEALCDLPGRREEKPIEQKVALLVPWSRNEILIPLHFLPALTASCRLHSSGSRKFLQVILKGVSDNRLILKNATMTCAAEGVTIIDVNPKSQNEIIMTKSLSISYLYEIQVEALKAERELPVIHVDYRMSFADENLPEELRYYIPYSVTFDVMDYTTLFTICAKIEPSELCRVNSVCHLNLRISKVHANPFSDLMYEVLADQNMWVVVGRTAGVISMEEVESHSITLEVLPLTAGFLPLPNVRLSKYISMNKSKTDTHPRLQPFPPGQIYNSTKSMQIHVLASNNTDA
ncbi:trafficking protein particle complex subunit 10 [Sabethes cyaneus]|uniref:trafficking protein particle complex subunit 10 n=1 Tax=Sabethes cyaneus TaxID=53552 RepID=UPI00237DD0A6|nr:trafficking protein particle complex subunit 10 [Sabethes cyaneus]